MKHTHLSVLVSLPGLTLVYRVRSCRSHHPPPESGKTEKNSELTAAGDHHSVCVLILTTNVVTNL